MGSRILDRCKGRSLDKDVIDEELAMAHTKGPGEAWSRPGLPGGHCGLQCEVLGSYSRCVKGVEILHRNHLSGNLPAGILRSSRLGDKVAGALLRALDRGLE